VLRFHRRKTVPKRCFGSRRSRGVGCAGALSAGREPPDSRPASVYELTFVGRAITVLSPGSARVGVTGRRAFISSFFPRFRGAAPATALHGRLPIRSAQDACLTAPPGFAPLAAKDLDGLEVELDLGHQCQRPVRSHVAADCAPGR
jgi:hypothetical protein